MRHMGRTHGVSLTWITNELKEKRCELGYIKTKYMAADIFTKFYPKDKKDIWASVRQLIGVFTPDEVNLRMETSGVVYIIATERRRDKYKYFVDRE